MTCSTAGVLSATRAAPRTTGRLRRARGRYMEVVLILKHCTATVDLRPMKNNFVMRYVYVVSKFRRALHILLGGIALFLDCLQSLQDSFLVYVLARVQPDGPQHEHEARAQAARPSLHLEKPP